MVSIEKAHQRSGPRLDKDVENELWKRFSHARTAFDKKRKTWFAQLDEQHGQAKALKEKLVREAGIPIFGSVGDVAGVCNRFGADPACSFVVKERGGESKGDPGVGGTRPD